MGDEFEHSPATRRASLLFGLALFVAILLAPKIPGISSQSPPLEGKPQRALAVCALVAFWWISQPAPIVVTSLLPLALFPVFGVLSSADVSKAYGDESIYLYLGGFIIALAMQKCHLHRRIALNILACVGTSPRRLLLGMMLATGFVSMWISNTSTAMMMLPIGLAILEESDRGGGAGARPFAVSMMLGISYGATIGGMATPVGTPTNMVYFGNLRTTFGDLAPTISFAQWLAIFGPMTLVFLLLAWGCLALRIPAQSGADDQERRLIDEQVRKLGPMTSAERWVSAVFVTAGFLWIFRRPLPLGFTILPGWSDGLVALTTALGWSDFDVRYVGDSTVALALACLLFFLRADGKPLMDWESASKLPWDALLLFGGGFALAAAFQASGLAHWIGLQFDGLAGAPIPVLVLGVCVAVTLLSEVTSNVATCTMLMPILASLSVRLEIDPRLLMLSATLSASLGFMLPVATPPNAIVFGSGRLRVSDMIRWGFILNLIGVMLVSATILLVVAPGLSLKELPPWAKPNSAGR